jgi:hypothetical protein
LWVVSEPKLIAIATKKVRPKFCREMRRSVQELLIWKPVREEKNVAPVKDPRHDI